jgi:hypothetical protein
VQSGGGGKVAALGKGGVSIADCRLPDRRFIWRLRIERWRYSLIEAFIAGGSQIGDPGGPIDDPSAARINAPIRNRRMVNLPMSLNR